MKDRPSDGSHPLRSPFGSESASAAALGSIPDPSPDLIFSRPCGATVLLHVRPGHYRFAVDYASCSSPHCPSCTRIRHFFKALTTVAREP